ncbi:MAG: AMP-binding protein, partial [Paracoccaceae bacterium]
MTNTLYDALFAPLANRPGPLLILPDGATITGTAFLAMVAQTGHALRAAGVQPGDRVAAQVPKSPLALALYGATVAVGAIFLPLNTAYTPAEIDYFIGNATPRLFVCDPDRNAALTPVATAHGAAVLTLDGAGHGSLATALAGQPDRLTPA